MTTETEIQKVTQEVGSIASLVAPALTAAIPGAAPVVEGVQAVISTASAVEGAIPHNTAIAAIGAGVSALAATPIVQSNPQAAGIAKIVDSFFGWLHSEFAKL